MVKKMKPRKIYEAHKAGTITEINYRGDWYKIGSVSLIGSGIWTVRDPNESVICRAAGGATFEVR